MFKITIQIKAGRTKKVITVYGVRMADVNPDNKGSGKGDLWIYLDDKNKEYNKDLLLCWCIKSSYKPTVISASVSTMDFRFTDDTITKYAF